jgi:hypothetical protein
MKVKNKAAAPRQVTAEQLLRESKEIQLEDDYKAPKTIITDPEELAEYRCVEQSAGAPGGAACAGASAVACRIAGRRNKQGAGLAVMFFTRMPGLPAQTQLG